MLSVPTTMQTGNSAHLQDRELCNSLLVEVALCCLLASFLTLFSAQPSLPHSVAPFHFLGCLQGAVPISPPVRTQGVMVRRQLLMSVPEPLVRCPPALSRDNPSPLCSLLLQGVLHFQRTSGTTQMGLLHFYSISDPCLLRGIVVLTSAGVHVALSRMSQSS